MVITPSCRLPRTYLYNSAAKAVGFTNDFLNNPPESLVGTQADVETKEWKPMNAKWTKGLPAFVLGTGLLMGAIAWAGQRNRPR